MATVQECVELCKENKEISFSLLEDLDLGFKDMENLSKLVEETTTSEVILEHTYKLIQAVSSLDYDDYKDYIKQSLPIEAEFREKSKSLLVGKFFKQAAF